MWSGTAAEERCRKSARKRTEPTRQCTPLLGLYETPLLRSQTDGHDEYVSPLMVFECLYYPSHVRRSALMSPKRAPTARPGRDRFTAESYTVLGENTHSR